MKHTKILLFLLFVSAFVVRILFSYAAPIKIWDETVYLNLGTDLSHNLLDYSFSNGWSDFIPSSHDPYGYPNAGFRAPLLPYTIALLHIFHLSFLINYLMPTIGALSVLLVYFLGKELFNKKVGLLAALFFAFIPLHIVHSSKVLTDVVLTFFVLLSFLSFWKGYEKQNNTYKVLFGLFFALALLSRYTALWVLPIFLLYIVFRGKLFSFLRDKYLYLAIGTFIITITPWLIYGLFIYNNPLGPFIHGSLAANYWGGVQAWYHFFTYWWNMFSAVGYFLIFSLFLIVLKKDFIKKEILFLLTWFGVFLAFAIYQPHKEDRFLLPLLPAIVLLCGYAIERYKKHKKKIIWILVGFLLISLSLDGYKMYKENHNFNANCYKQVGAKLSSLKGEFLIVSENSSLFRNFAEQENTYYPDKITEESINNLANSTDKKVLFVLTSYNSGLSEEKEKALQNILKKNYDLVYECPQYKEVNWMYLKANKNGENLVPNNSFEDEDDTLWVTNTSQSVSVDKENKGSEPAPLKSAKVIGSATEADLHTALIPVERDVLYQFNVHVDARELKSGELGFLIDEYDRSGKWIRAVWAGSADLKSQGSIGTIYTVDSPRVHAIRIHAYLEKGANGTAYLDNYQLFKIE